MKKLKNNLIFFFVALAAGAAIIVTNKLAGIGENVNIALQITVALCAACISFFIPELITKLVKSREKSKKARELRFLKKLFVISGSVKPADFVRVIKTLIPRSFYYRELLENILENHKKSNMNMEIFYTNLLKETDDLALKLFCEKLNMAANYDFDKAVKSIEEDFEREQREYARFVKKKIEIINIVGVVGMFLIITILMLWLLGPWLSMLTLEDYL
ncbi:MAG: hypothetical protein II748_03190 [Clostridia bacterium]|nr:hypothetical protein [Clostridia bacterium]